MIATRLVVTTFGVLWYPAQNDTTDKLIKVINRSHTPHLMCPPTHNVYCASQPPPKDTWYASHPRTTTQNTYWAIPPTVKHGTCSHPQHLINLLPPTPHMPIDMPSHHFYTWHLMFSQSSHIRQETVSHPHFHWKWNVVTPILLLDTKLVVQFTFSYIFLNICTFEVTMYNKLGKVYSKG